MLSNNHETINYLKNLIQKIKKKMKNNYKEIYYSRIVSLITKLHNNEFETAKPGHCMKITGLW